MCIRDSGYPVTLYDTAGLRPEQLTGSSHDVIEAEGIRRALEKAQEADFKILLFDGRDNAPHTQTLALKDGHSICVANKIDAASSFADMIGISAKTGENLGALLDVVSRETQNMFEAAANTPSLTRARHRDALMESQAYIQQALDGDSPDLIAEDIRMAVRGLGKITGRTDVEDLLDIIFRDFCIGK